MKPYITTENCLTFGHEYGNHDHEDYFKFGSLARKKSMIEREEERKNATTLAEDERKNVSFQEREKKRYEAMQKWDVGRRGG